MNCDSKLIVLNFIYKEGEDMPQARYEKRFMAYIIDVAIALAIALYITTTYSIRVPLKFMDYMTTLSILTSVIFFIYIVLFYLIFNGLSIGRMIFNCRIVTKEGKRMRPLTIVMRALLQAILPLAILNIGYMLLYRTQESFYEKATDTMNVMWH